MGKVFKFLSILTLILSSYCVTAADWKPILKNSQFFSISEVNSFNGTLYAISKRNKNWNSYESTVDQIYVSYDNGANWSPLPSIDEISKLEGSRIDRILITPQGFLVVSGISKYLKDENGYPRVTVYVSQNSGKTFKNVFKSEPYFCCSRTTHIAQDTNGNLVLGYSQNHEIRLVKSLDGGESWSQFASIPQMFSTNPDGNWFSYLSSGQLFITEESGDIYSSNFSSTQIVTKAIDRSYADSLYAFQSNNSGVLLQTGKYYGLKSGYVRISLDSGKSWSITDVSDMVLASPFDKPAVSKIFDFGRNVKSSADSSITVRSFGFAVTTWYHEDSLFRNDVSFCENVAKGFDCKNFGSQGIKYIIGANRGIDGKDYLYVFDEENDKLGILTVLQRQ